MTTMADLQAKCTPNWCPGCGNLPLWSAFKNACVDKGWDNTNTTIVADVGCHGHIVNFTKITSVEGLHGRSIPVSTGIKMANKRLNVFNFIGDGGCLGEGGNHFIHVCRRNHNINVFIHDNALYALTTGQTSPASPHMYESKSTPRGNFDHPLNPLAMAISAGATFVARAYAGDIEGTADLMKKAADHNGISIVDILQPCVTFNKQFTHMFYRENTYYLDESYDPTNKMAAFEKAHEFGEKAIPLGVFYKDENKPSYEDLLTHVPGNLVDTNVDRGNMDDLLKHFA